MTHTVITNCSQYL